MRKRPRKLIQLPVQPPTRLSEAEWAELARETFAERTKDDGKVPDRRRAPLPTWYPPATEPEQDK